MARVFALLFLLFGCALAAFTQYSVTRPNSGKIIAIPQIIDYNGDGRNDFVVHTQTATGGEFHVIINNGGYSFASPQLLVAYTASGLHPSYCAGDFDNDNDIDIAGPQLYNSTHAQIVTYENRGGSFLRRVISGPLAETYSIACTDINSDGKLDVISNTWPNVRAYYNQGCFTFSEQVITADSDCHQPAFKPGTIKNFAYPNVVFSACWSSVVQYIYYNGASIAANKLPNGNYNSFSIGLADFNGDSYTDVVANGMTCWNMNTYIYNSSTSTFTQNGVPNAPGYSCHTRSFTSAGDLDGNGYGDIISEVNYGVFIYWYSAGATTTESLGTYTSKSVAYDYPIFTTGQLSGRGASNVDLVLVNGDSTLTIFATCPACASCPANSYVNSAGTCVACPTDQQSAPGARSCARVCSAGMYGTYPLCTECPAGSNSAAGAASCTQCAANQVSPGGSVACSTCGANTYPMAKSVCAACPLGTFSTAGSTSCTTCPSGSVRGCTDTACVTCPAGTFAAGHTCTPCTAGTFSSAGASSCSKCASGTYSGSGAASCTACPAGYTSSSTNVFCYLA